MRQVLPTAFLLAAACLAGCAREIEATPQDGPAEVKPLRIVFTGYLDGHLEPCGCASAQAGGVDRRAWWLRLNRHRFDLKLEGGNLIRRNDPLERFKFMWIQTILADYMGYAVLPLGPHDLSLGSEELAMFCDEKGAPFLVTDLRKVAGGKRTAPYPTYSIQEAGPYRVCVLSLAGPDGRPAPEGYEVLPPEDAVHAALARAGARGKAYDICVTFVNYGGAATARRLARKLPGVDLVAGFAPALETIEKPEVQARDRARDGVPRTTVLFPGWHGKNLLLWEGRPDGGGWRTSATKKEILQVPDAVKGKRPPGSDPEVWNMLIDSKRQLGEGDILEQMAERRPTRNGARYVGNRACAECHEDSTDVWQGTAHSEAWASLVARQEADGWPVTRHPDCVGCHTVGYGERSGFVNTKKTPGLVDVGCEACHGAGSAHVARMRPIQGLLDAGKPVPAAQLAAARKGGTLGKVGPRGCFRCHDFEQSPGFDFQERWEEVEHGLDK